MQIKKMDKKKNKKIKRKRKKPKPLKFALFLGTGWGHVFKKPSHQIFYESVLHNVEINVPSPELRED